MTPVQFVPFASSLAPDFWHALTQLKLHVLKLNDDPVPISAFYERGRVLHDRVTGQDVSLQCTLHLDADSFRDPPPASTSERVYVRGVLRNYNTIEDFKKVDKVALLNEQGGQIRQRFNNAETTFEDLNTFTIITFADLKKYKYYYWCAFAAVAQKPGWELCDSSWRPFTDAMSSSDIEGIDAHAQSTPAAAFALRRDRAGRTEAITELAKLNSNDSTTIVLNDPAAHPSAVGWPLRNMLAALSEKQVDQVRLVCLRASQAGQPSKIICGTIRRLHSTEAAPNGDAIVGWEKNAQGKLSARVVDLSPLMDPTRLADQAVDLNLQLMRWRIMPSLDLEKVKSTSCLLLGAGTLGCYVARTLMAWGVRKITLVDNGAVSFSNPVRQPLFEFADTVDGGKPKARAAADALKRIYPSIEAEGIEMSIPMPGHPVPPAHREQCERDVTKLEELIDKHDVTFLLMDSRESRWLPSLVGAAKNKLIMNVALGFDTFLAMRHGLANEQGSRSLGCYYCNDIVAPMDSLSDRTLDQMCTVTRPGIASIASSTAVELLVSLLQHPRGAHAASEVSSVTDSSLASPLGIVPHQIRGMLSQFENMKMTGAASEYCTACSPKIVEAYRENGISMLMEAFANAASLEWLTGLDELQKQAEQALADLGWDDEDDDSVDQ